ncbi:MAG: FMN-binding protein [Candidatus Atribacteria bacterium]|nr:FMN-binding protein [Candidatus Atribacteria bacterium]
MKKTPMLILVIVCIMVFGNSIPDRWKNLSGVKATVRNVPYYAQNSTGGGTGTPVPVDIPIDQKTVKAFQKVFPGITTFDRITPPSADPQKEVVIQEIFRALSNGNVTGYIFKVKSQGYRGPVVTLIGISASKNALTGIQILEQKETPSLGDMITRPSFLIQFLNKSINDTFILDQDVQAVSGATTSSSAVVSACQEAIAFLRQQKKP